MNASTFSRELAERLNRDANTILIFDRTLAEAGLRGKARGRHAPDITTSEAVLLLLAFLSGRPATAADKAALDLANFTLAVHQSDNTLTTFHHAFGLENDFAELLKKPLGDLLALLCRRMANGKFGRDNFAYLEITDGSVAELQLELTWLPTDRSQRLGLRGEIAFVGAVSLPTDRSRGYYYESRTVTPALLQWIGENTVDSPVAMERG
jgi:hypothetical protein